MRPPLRVLHVTPSYLPAFGGIEEFIRALCAYSRRTAAIEPRICVCNNADEGLPVNELHEGTPVQRLRCRGRGPMRWVPDISHLKAQVDVVHLHDPHVGALTARFAFAGPARPVVLSTHGGFFHTKRMMPLKHLHFGLLAPLLLSRVNTVVASSEQDFRLFQNATPNVVRIDNGIDFERCRAAGAADLPEHGTFVYLGRLARNKRVDRLLPVIALLRTRYGRNVRLDVVGGDTDGLLDGLRARAAQLGLSEAVVFHGRAPNAEAIRIVSRSRYLISASEYEGFGLSVVEAMAAGAIPVVSDIAAFRAFIDDGANGALVDFSDAGHAAARIDQVLALPRFRIDAMRAAAIETARRYSWSERVYRFVEIYQAIAGGEPSDAMSSVARGAP